MATVGETAISNENIGLGLDHMTRDRLYLNRINALVMTCQRDILCTGTIHIRDIIHVLLYRILHTYRIYRPTIYTIYIIVN